MKAPFKFRDIPAGFADRFPDGDYTVGRGADPRSSAERAAEQAAKAAQDSAVPDKKVRPAKARKRVTRPAAE